MDNNIMDKNKQKHLYMTLNMLYSNFVYFILINFYLLVNNSKNRPKQSRTLLPLVSFNQSMPWETNIALCTQ